MPGNPLQLGDVIGTGKPIILPASARERHLYVCGGTGVGKSKFLEHCVRQDILNWNKSRCGLILFDPHGLVYENTMAWLARHGLKRPIVPFDLRRDDWIVSYNLLRQRKETAPSVIVANFVRALAHVWGQDGTDRTPLFAKWATVIFLTLYQNGQTIADVMQLLSRADVRRAMAANVTDETARHAWQFAERNPKEFENQITSTLNRFQRLLGPLIMKATLGQPDVSLDLLTAMNEGQIVLVNLSTEGGQIDDEDADTFATLLLTDLWSAAKSRGKQEREKIRPFYVYVDECQNFITPTIAKNLDQARGFGLHLTLAHQSPSQLLNAGPHGKAMYDSILANAGNKIIFRTEHPDDVKLLAQSLFMGTFDPDQVKLILRSTKVMDYREEIQESHTTGTGTTSVRATGRGGGSFAGQSLSEGEGGSDPYGAVENWNNAVADSSGESNNWTETETEGTSHSESVTRTRIRVPVLGQEISSVQHRSIEEQLFLAMQKLFSQEDRHFAIRFSGGPKAPLFVKTPTVEPVTVRKQRVEQYREELLKHISFALTMPDAVKRLGAREEKLLTDVVQAPFSYEPATSKRRIK